MNQCMWCLAPWPTDAHPPHPEDPEDAAGPGQWHLMRGVCDSEEWTCPQCCEELRPWIGVARRREPDYGAVSQQEQYERAWAEKRTWE